MQLWHARPEVGCILEEDRGQGIPCVPALKLHNLCVDNRLEELTCFEDGRWQDSTRADVLAPDGPFVYVQNNCATEIVHHRRSVEQSGKRDAICAALQLAGLRRPAVRGE